MKTYLITGTTSGLGLEITKALAADPENIIIMANRDRQKGDQTAEMFGDRVRSVVLDLSTLKGIANFIRDWDIKLDGLINNAGVQYVNETKHTSDGFEQTIAVNHLAAFMLTIGLSDYLAGGRVLFMGSGTHNPNHFTAKLFGFSGAKTSSIPDLLEGRTTAASIKKANLDRYAASKFLNIVSALEFSRRTTTFSSFVLDPGLMPGTGLARHQNKILQFLWKRVMPAAGAILPDTTRVTVSAQTAAWIMTAPDLPYPSGQVVSYDRQPYRYLWKEKVCDPETGQQVFDDSLSVINHCCNLNLSL